MKILLRLCAFFGVAGLCISAIAAEATLRIDKAYIGAAESWRDVTGFLQEKIQGDTLQLEISQPFDEIGGDPAVGLIKVMVIDYHLNGQTLRLLLDEKLPVAFKVSLPSTEAMSPGQDSKAQGIVNLIKRCSVSKPQSQTFIMDSQKISEHFLSSLALGVSFLALICASFAAFQLYEVKRELQRSRGSK